MASPDQGISMREKNRRRSITFIADLILPFTVNPDQEKDGHSGRNIWSLVPLEESKKKQAIPC